MYLRGVAATKKLLAPDAIRAPILHAAVNDVPSWLEISRIQMTESARGVFTEDFNLADRTAQALLAQAYGGDPTRLQRVLVDGDPAVAGRLAAHIIRRAARVGLRPELLVLGEAALAVDHRHPAFENWFPQGAAIQTIDDRAVANLEPKPALLVVCGAEGKDVPTISRATLLARQLPGIPVVVSIYGEGTEEVLDLTRSASNITLVPAKAAALARDLLSRTSVELLARARHEEYQRRQAPARGHAGNQLVAHSLG